MYTVVLLMAGSGTRMKKGKNKMLLPLAGKPLYTYALDTFLSLNLEVVLVVSKDDYKVVLDQVPSNVKVVIGGATRTESVYLGLKEVSTPRVLIHDGARVFVSREIIEECIKCESEAFFVGIPLKDTIRDLYTMDTPNRTHYCAVQTPQGGNTELFKKSIKLDKNYFDDIEYIKDYTKDIKMVCGNEYNFKVTTPFDYELAKIIVKGEISYD